MGIFDLFSKNKNNHETNQSHNDNSVQGVETPSDEPTQGLGNDAAPNNAHDADDMFWQSFLLNETKFNHQEKTVKRASKSDNVDLRYIFKEILGIKPEDIGSMTIVSRGMWDRNDESFVIKSPEHVLAYKPFEATLRVNENGETVPRTGQNTVLIISYRPSNVVFDNAESVNDKSKLCTDNSIIMYLRGLGPFMHETAFMRVSVMIPNFNSPDDLLISHSKNAPFTTSFILGFDIVPPEGKIKRYEEIEKSLRLKVANGEELTSDEKTVLEGITYSREIGYEFGYGKWLVEQKRFADALLSLFKVYDILKVKIIKDYDEVKATFFETCYNIGYCFNEMEQFDRATYYLEQITDHDNIKYIVEYVNALVNNKDPRAMSIVRRLLDDFDKGRKQFDSTDNANLYNFLARRLAYLYVEYEWWDAAKHLLEQMKENPGCRDFAIQELNYIRLANGQ